jgi:glucose/mannose-6-phosphate isomerase
MKDILRTYNSQFTYIPEILNEHMINKHAKQFVICGMGGSHLPVGILKTIQPGIDMYVHREYDLPPFSKNFLEQSTLVAMSYSGNTEEVISFYKKAKQLYDMPVVCIATGGALIELAQAANDPYVILPHSDFVPRTALGYSTIALASLLKDKTTYHALQQINLDIQSIEEKAKDIYRVFQKKIPVFYASNQNLHLAYNWKIKMNETAKQPSFYNVFPEANHNELESYEFFNSHEIVPIILLDTQDDIRIQKRFKVFSQLLTEKNIQHITLDISHSDMLYKIFNSIVLGDFVTTYLAEDSGVPIAKVPLIEEFKKRII